ncbi:MAG: hypothetical protein ACE15D_00125 [Candidatus Eisenbacteria bacterium]
MWNSASIPNENVPCLYDARERVTRLIDRAASGELPAAIANLESLDREYAPHPLVRHALARLRLRAGSREQARESLTRALDLLVARGHLRLAADLCREYRDAGVDPDRVAESEASSGGGRR